MIAVIFEVLPEKGRMQDYLDIAADLLDRLHEIEGFVSIERFESITEPGKILSLSFWQSEECIKEWRNISEHRKAQTKGRTGVFKEYRLRVAHVLRDYGMNDRNEVPIDSHEFHD